MQSWLRILALGLFFVFSATLVNNAIFQHSHLMPDGTVVVHAHPFERGDDSQTPENHHHDCFELVCIQAMQNHFFILPDLEQDAQVPPAKEFFNSCFLLLFCEEQLCFAMQGRPPPSLCC